jgi:catechol 2,3-dioxygenase-like lactoylglutathione lyase family enzyme
MQRRQDTRKFPRENQNLRGRFFVFQWRVFIFNARMNIFVEHIAIPAANPVALKDWYQQVLGARTVFDNGQTPPTCLLALGSVWFEIYQAEAPLNERGNNKLAGFRHIALRVPSLAAAKLELEQRGVQFAGEVRPAAGGGKVLFFADSEGNLLHLVERPADSLPGN